MASLTYHGPLCPAQCGSVGWTSSHKTKSHRFDSHSGHIPRSLVRSPVGVHMRGNRWIFLSFSFYFPSPLSKNRPLRLEAKHLYSHLCLTSCLSVSFLACKELSLGNGSTPYLPLGFLCGVLPSCRLRDLCNSEHLFLPHIFIFQCGKDLPVPYVIFKVSIYLSRHSCDSARVSLLSKSHRSRVWTGDFGN